MAQAPSAAALSRMALREPDPEAASEIWDEVIRLEEEDGGRIPAEPSSTRPDGKSSSRPVSRINARYERGNCLLKLRRFKAALRDYSAALPALQLSRLSPGGKMATLPSGGAVPEEVVILALALDGMGLAQGQLGRWPEALESHTRAVGTAAAAGAYEAELPVNTAFSGLRGGAGEGLMRKRSSLACMARPLRQLSEIRAL